jgi:hydrogenase maturation protein HypF
VITAICRSHSPFVDLEFEHQPLTQSRLALSYGTLWPGLLASRRDKFAAPVITDSDSETLTRVRLQLRGRVQGVGFRPFVYRTAQSLGLSGWVRNDALGVLLEAEGPLRAVKTFIEKVVNEPPAPGSVDDWNQESCAVLHDTGFVIVASQSEGPKLATLLPELATCAQCLRELSDPSNRRYHYPFTNCTHCGPRFTIIRSLPYDRPNTTMAHFTQCADCQREYDDPNDRRFHAQPNACPVCGPQLSYVDAARKVLGWREHALALAVEAIAAGSIVAVQGLGGFHLMVDATNDSAVRRLRQRKHRWEKPLAVMLQHTEQVREHVEVPALVAALLTSTEAPIVLCRKHEQSSIAASVAPDTPYLGVMIASNPLHHLLLQRLQRPVVATSGNLSEEPICIDPEQAQQRLAGIADGWLVHDRPIERHMDDSVMHLIGGSPQFLRRARGFAPLPVAVPASDRVVLALGGHQKNTIALAVRDRVFVSQHIGDLDSLETREASERVVRDFLELYAVKPDVVAHDLHPDYASSKLAEALTSSGGWLAGVLRLAVQHHHAHLAACLADAGHEGRALGVIWDGSGLGLDGTLWGGEFLLGDAHGFERLAALKPYPLLGGEAAARDPRRAALSLLASAIGPEGFDAEDLPCVASIPAHDRALLRRMFASQSSSPMTSSVGRLFDAVAALCGLVTSASFEGRAGMLLESHCGAIAGEHYPLPCVGVDAATASEAAAPRYWLDTAPLIQAVVADVRAGAGATVVATRFHAALVAAVLEIADRAGADCVALSGGCFQNRVLTEACVSALQKKKLKVVIHRRLPPNDGGLCLGQALVARAASHPSSE